MIPAGGSLPRCDHRLPGRAPSASQHQLQSTGGVPPAMAIPVSGSRISLGCLRMVIRTCLWGAIEHSPRVPSLYLSRSLRDAVRQESSFETDPFNCCSGQTSRLWSHARSVSGQTNGLFGISRVSDHLNDQTLNLPAASGSEVSLVALCQADTQTC